MLVSMQLVVSVTLPVVLVVALVSLEKTQEAVDDRGGKGLPS